MCLHPQEHISPPQAAERVEGSHISGWWQISVPLVTKILSPPFCLVHSRGTRPSRDAQGKGRDIRDQTGYKYQQNIMHRDADPLHPSLSTLHSPGSDLDGKHCWKPSSTDLLLKGREQWDDKLQTAI